MAVKNPGNRGIYYKAEGRRKGEATSQKPEGRRKGEARSWKAEENSKAKPR
jgi:hypothetical protein